MASIGVEVTTSLRSGPSNTGTQSGRFHVAGLTERGPVGKAVVVRSLANFVSVFGDRTAYNSALFDTAQLFFEEGGSELVVSRAVGAGASAGSLSLLDTDAVAPAPTVRIEAVAPGAYSSELSVEVTASGSTFDVLVRQGTAIVARFVGMTSPTDLVSAARGNAFVKVTDLGSASAAPTNNPAPLASTPLSGGTDDRASVTADTIIAALEAAGNAARGGAVAAPGYTATVIGAQLAAHAKAYSKIALLAPDVDETAESVGSIVPALALGDTGDYAGLFFPHLIIPDGSGTRTVGPEGYVAAVRNRAHVESGFWQVPAGDRARTRWALGTVTEVDTATNNELADAFVNGIVTTGARVRLYNWSSLSADRENLGYLTARDVLNNLDIQVREALEPFVFSVLDGKRQLLAHVESAVVSVLDPIAKRDGFYRMTDAAGDEVDPGYRVIVDETNNTLSNSAANEVLVSVAVRLSPTAALIKVEIIKVALAATV